MLCLLISLNGLRVQVVVARNPLGESFLLISYILWISAEVHCCKVKPPEVWGLRDVTLRARRRLRLVCRTQGTPLPAVLWYKDGVRVTPSRRVRVQHNKKKSALIIARVKPSDGGRYECKAVSVIGRQDSASAAVSVQVDARQDNTTTLWPLVGRGCFFDAYCLNGGTCTYYDTVGELVCQCAEGYKGQRCENKDVINRGSMYRPLSYFCKLGISNSYYC
ncbi:protein vein isoform X3 [Frankliniella occidentalis]|uniref:Protein vein isoform X3 n=1 Tax=Frankliniella occidentalis TaxID=133901 RepID=A0A9C6WYU8_FRAOC|nr:protein vein isoform X3 [Frankliniella occidentalis]